jgi:hypothetical protein
MPEVFFSSPTRFKMSVFYKPYEKKLIGPVRQKSGLTSPHPTHSFAYDGIPSTSLPLP